MQLFWVVSYRPRPHIRRVSREFEDVLEFNAFIKTMEGGSDLQVGFKFKAKAGEMLPAFLPRFFMPVKESR